MDDDTIAGEATRLEEGKQPDLVKEQEKQNIELVVFSFNDPEDPKNFPQLKKIRIVIILCILSFISWVASLKQPPDGQY